MRFLTSKTFWGAIGAAIAYVMAQPDISIIVVAQAVSGVLVAIGIGDKIDRAGSQ